MPNAMEILSGMGQSIWYDNIARNLIDSGELARLIQNGIIRGLTSNPTIFEKAVSGSSDYDALIRTYAQAGADVPAIYLELVTRDIRDAADLLRSVHVSTGGKDGYVSVEVSPDLAHDPNGTVREAIELVRHLDRPNVMIKVPGTAAGVPAIRRLTAEGVSVNVTLLFTARQYEAAADAYLSGLEDRLQAGKPLDTVASVASFFVSRVDTRVDKLLLERLPEEEPRLRGRAAIANARVVYERSLALAETARWKALANRGARFQRLLWASTSTKDARYPDTLYVDRLVAPDTVNTVPPKTLEAFLDHGRPVALGAMPLEEAQGHIARLREAGIDLEAVGEALQDEGVVAFQKSMESLLQEISRSRDALAG